jgi:type I restriction enzyme S subunit
LSKFIQLGEICDIVKGNIGITKAIEGEYTLVTTAEERRTHNQFQFDKPAVIVPLVSATGHGHASIKRIHYEEEKYSIGSILAACIPKNEAAFSAKFLYIYFNLMKDYVLVPLMKGSANVSLTITNLKTANVPNLKLERQLEIVSQFEKLEIKNNLLKDELILQNEDLSKLRQAILQEAVQGKLVHQAPNDEPASILLEKIKKEKAALIEAKKIRKEKPLPPISEDEMPYELPEGWEWSRLQSLCSYIVDCPHSTPTFLDKGEYCIDTTCITQGAIHMNKIRKVSKETFEDRNRRLVPKAGDIVYSREGTLGLSFIIPKGLDVCLGQRVMIFRTSKYVVPEYFRTVLISKFFVDQWKAKKTGTASKHINIRDLRVMTMILPPLAEQKRIVKKVEELFSLCDALEVQLKESEADAGQLMQAVLQEAFGGE